MTAVADWESLCALIPEGRSGDAAIVHSTDGRRCILTLNGVPFMNDGPAERADLDPFRERARGRVLVLGLGLGLCLAATLDKLAVEKIVVIEVSPDVIRLVAPWWTAAMRALRPDVELKVEEGNAFDYAPVGLFDLVWIDIWATVHGGYWDEAERLRRRYEGHLLPFGSIGIWREETIRKNATCEICGAVRPSFTGVCASCAT